jgi:hypothetical protein
MSDHNQFLSVDQLPKLPVLKAEQRLAAKQQAREFLLTKLGGEPQIADFERQQWSRFGARINAFTLMSLIVVFASALIVSSGHIYRVFGNNPAMVILSESTILALSLVPTVWNTPRYVSAMMYAGVLGAALIAAVGNIDAEILYTSSPLNWLARWMSTFATAPKQWTAATVPPVITVLVGQALKYYALDRSASRHEAKRQYDDTLAEWKQTVATLEQRGDWGQAWADALWDTWRKGKKHELLAVISVELQVAIVRREMQAEQWFQGDFHGNSVKARESKSTESNSSVSPREKVISYLKDNGGEVGMEQQELAEFLGVSPATVSRAVKEFSSNGHGEG